MNYNEKKYSDLDENVFFKMTKQFLDKPYIKIPVYLAIGVGSLYLLSLGAKVVGKAIENFKTITG